MSKPPQHSPGPWTFHRNGWYIEDQEGNAIAEVNSAYTSDGRIMAAAPDMLRLLRVLVETHYSGEGGKQTWLVLNDALDETHKLIARLDGQQP